MKYLLTLLLFPCLTYGQQVLTIGNGLDLTNNTLTAKLQPIQDSLKNAYAIAVNANTTANNANTAAVNAQSTANGAVAVNSNQSLQITAANNNIASLQNQINNIVIPPSAGIPQPLIITSNYTVQLSDYDKTLYVNCSSCTISLPILTSGFRCFIVRDGAGIVYVKPAGITQTGATQIAARQGAQWVTYKTSTTANLQVR